MKLSSSAILFVLILGVPLESAAQGLKQTFSTHRKEVQFFVQKEKPDSQEVRLFSVVSGKPFEIDTLALRRSLSCMDGCDASKLELAEGFRPKLAPDGETVLYSDLTGCGYEGDGSVLYVSDLQGKNRSPLIARCNFVTPLFFFQHEGDWHVALEESNSGIGTVAAWIFNLKTRQPLVRVKGTLSESSEGQLKFCALNEEETPCKVSQRVGVSDLLRRKPSLPYLPRYPLRATVKKTGAVWIPHQGSTICFKTPEGEEKARTVPVKTAVSVLQNCEDGSVEIWLGKEHGTIEGTFLEGLGFKQGM